MKASSILTAVVLIAASGSALAQSDRGPRHHDRHGSEFRQGLLEKFDADGDGELNETERETARQAVREYREAAREKKKAAILEKFDANGDGELSGEEREEAGRAMHQFRNARERGQGRRGDRRHAMKGHVLERFDANEDGKLDGTERAAAKAHFEQKKAEIIEKFDADGSGKIDGDERKALGDYLRAERERTRMDINRDGQIDDKDVQAATSRVSAGERIPDFNKDGQSDALDVNALIEKMKSE